MPDYDVEIAIKVFSVNKKKTKVTDDDLDAFEEKLRRRTVALSQAIKDSERLTAEDFSVTVTV